MQGRTKATLPADALRRVELQEQVELFREQLILVRQVVTEQREGLGEYAATGDHLGTSARKKVDGGEVLEHPYRVCRTQNRHRAGQPNPRRHLCDRGQHDGRGGDREIEPVMLADGEHGEAGLVGQLGGSQDFL